MGQPKALKYAAKDLQEDLETYMKKQKEVELKRAKSEAALEAANNEAAAKKQAATGAEKPAAESTYGAAMVFGEETKKKRPALAAKAHDEWARGFWEHWPMPVR